VSRKKPLQKEEEQRGEMAVRGKQGGRDAPPQPSGSHACPRGRSSTAGAGAGAGAGAAAELPDSAARHGGSQMCARSAGRKTAFSCRNGLSHQLISVQGSPRQTEKLFL